MSKIRRYRWKGKLVTKEFYEQRIQCQKMGENNAGHKAPKCSLPIKYKDCDNDDDERIVSLKVLGREL